MGYEPIVSGDRSQITLKKLPTWKPPAIELAKQQAPKMMRLIGAVRGKRSEIEILAKSESANAEFI